MQRHLIMAFLNLCLFLSVALPAARQHLLPGDEAVYHALQVRQGPFLTTFFRAVTKAGSYKVLVPVGVSVLLWQISDWRLLLALGLYTLGVPLLERGTKLAIARPRPHDYLGVGLPSHISHGFPSGHTLAAAAFYGMLLLLLRRRVHSRGWRRVLTGGLLLLILLIGASRIYLGAHWPSDVLGGLALGGAYCWLAVALYEGKRVPGHAVHSP